MNKALRLIVLGSILSHNSGIYGISSQQLQNLLITQKHPFRYDLDIKIIPGDSDAVTVCCHGYGSSNRIINSIHSWNVINHHLVAFNFPDYDCIAKHYDPHTSALGSIDELLPLLYILKRCVVDGSLTAINLYGFSAGGGAIINMLAVLNQSKHDGHLKKIGILAEHKKQIINAIQQGCIILDCPLKSMEEVIAVRGKTKEMMIVAEHYAKNDMRPIDALRHLDGLTLNIIVHFQTPDEIIGNRDDKLFINRLQTINKGKTDVVLASHGGHNKYHASLWKHYKKIIR